jgi:hypothetical protein
MATAAFAQSNINLDHRWAWGENIGWINWRHGAEDPNRISVGVCVGDTFLAGFIWAENVGWINVGNGDGPYANDPSDSSTFGVNLDPNSDPNAPELVGYAWAENVGWINFEGGRLAEPPEPARLENGCRLRGYVWAENIGWINLDDDEKFVMALQGDLNYDEVVDLADLAQLLGHYGECNDVTYEDGDIFPPCGNGCVDLADLAELLRHYGETCP